MRYTYDFEFIEDGNTIDPVSLGIVGENGSQLHIINTDCNWQKAGDWVLENVLKPIHITRDGIQKRIEGIVYEGKSGLMPKTVANFFGDYNPNRNKITTFDGNTAKLWGYYSDYDHVALAQLWGPMVSLPKGLPMYTLDIKQKSLELGDIRLPKQTGKKHNALEDAKHIMKSLIFLELYPYLATPEYYELEVVTPKRVVTIGYVSKVKEVIVTNKNNQVVDNKVTNSALLEADKARLVCERAALFRSYCDYFFKHDKEGRHLTLKKENKLRINGLEFVNLELNNSGSFLSIHNTEIFSKVSLETTDIREHN